MCIFPFWALRPPCNHSGVLRGCHSYLHPHNLYKQPLHAFSFGTRKLRRDTLAGGVCWPAFPELHTCSACASHASCPPVCHSPGNCTDLVAHLCARWSLRALFRFLGEWHAPPTSGRSPSGGGGSPRSPRHQRGTTHNTQGIHFRGLVLMQARDISSIFASVQCAIMT